MAGRLPGMGCGWLWWGLLPSELVERFVELHGGLVVELVSIVKAAIEPPEMRWSPRWTSRMNANRALVVVVRLVANIQVVVRIRARHAGHVWRGNHLQQKRFELLVDAVLRDLVPGKRAPSKLGLATAVVGS
jgi:hypothetical protein